jgi:2'-5' RNA ligase
VAGKHSPFTLHLRGTGTFRPLTEVVYVAVAAGTGDCERLASAVRELPAIDRPLRYEYHPHVTVAQDVPSTALDEVFADLAGFDASFMVSGFTLFEHGRDGRWRPHREYCLGNGDAPAPMSHRRR